jgi:diaminohydroxyphosphoribosylaminopyrimidine deaminase/5-amino-6-(5-phosphoribosylamino)uracil reductase
LQEGISYEKLMKQCLVLAQKGAGAVSPNPKVGAIILRNGKIIGSGFHHNYGGIHAEIDAFQNALRAKNSTLIVNLEPCSHFGKTPPCTDEIIKQKISRVVIGTKDPNPIVAGRGIKKMRSAGIDVITGVLENDCKKFNEFFFKYITKKLPFVALKAAQTIDGKIADSKNNSRWISSEQSRKLVHSLRAEYDAILIGAGTARADNPSLTVRLTKGRNPHRIVLNGNFSIPVTNQVFQKQTNERVFFYTSNKCYQKFPKRVAALTKQGIEIIPMNSDSSNKLDLHEVMQSLAEYGITSVLVEGGASLFSQFLEQQLADKVILFIAPKILGQGKNIFESFRNFSLQSSVNLKNISFLNSGNDIVYEGYL